MNPASGTTGGKGSMDLSRAENDGLIVHLTGDWKITEDLPAPEPLIERIRGESGLRNLAFETGRLEAWDSGLLTFLRTVIDFCETNRIETSLLGLPDGVRRLLALASAIPEQKGARKTTGHLPFLARIGDATLAFFTTSREMLHFIGEATMATLRLFRGRAQFRRSDLFVIIQDCGARALPIVSLISVLVGLILAFVGAIQLVLFGAQIYVAGLVGIAMVRVMGAIMTGIIMAGRTGASFAAHLGTMQVNEEIDALETMGISPTDFLVLPRMIALAIMMPLLCIYADLMGILGGLIVGVFMLDLNVMEYYHMTVESVGLNDFLVGLFQAAVFGVLVALTGCMKGIHCGRSASAVGTAVTGAVVTGIVSIIVATALITVMCNVIGI